ncbi:hypothetical protein RFI_06153 [Reticulomyxa filosa]|uniref:TNFR-Cys domain-containing protein n=1 Tax=Reticulomyxa filosa TaxID=46433 RepID=X6P0B9_RETFI|nr:hypothetical protein RFI_06153 [Reticulomyxa filosa]|eukprot:ETO30967.1 hypothetical protein RFI_06153 [Reticulomyxa filosa]
MLGDHTSFLVVLFSLSGLLCNVGFCLGDKPPFRPVEDPLNPPNPFGWTLTKRIREDNTAVMAYTGTATNWCPTSSNVCGYPSNGSYIALSDKQFPSEVQCSCSQSCPLEQFSQNCPLQVCGNCGTNGCDSSCYCAPSCNVPCGEKWCVQCDDQRCNNKGVKYQVEVSDACPEYHPCNVANCCTHGQDPNWCPFHFKSLFGKEVVNSNSIFFFQYCMFVMKPNILKLSMYTSVISDHFNKLLLNCGVNTQDLITVVNFFLELFATIEV